MTCNDQRGNFKMAVSEDATLASKLQTLVWNGLVSRPTRGLKRFYDKLKLNNSDQIESHLGRNCQFLERTVKINIYIEPAFVKLWADWC
jgi:hypothetical protein